MDGGGGGGGGSSGYTLNPIPNPRLCSGDHVRVRWNIYDKMGTKSQKNLGYDNCLAIYLYT
jgi:hypothetical protein